MEAVRISSHLWNPWAVAYAAAREWRRRRHGARPERIGVPVVSVGSVQAGGAGKTPLAVAVANLLSERGLVVGVAMLGSGGRRRARPRLLPPGAPADPVDVGDEVALLRRKAPTAVVAVGRDRTGGARALAAGGVGVVVVEDGYQWSSLHRDLDLVAASPASGGAHPIPRGRLREWPSAYARADACVALPGTDRGVLRRWADGLPVAEWETGEPYWTDLAGRRVDAPPPGLPLAAAVGDPESLESELEAEGLAPGRLRLPDHAPGREARERVVRVARAQGGVLLTEKDAARWEEALAGVPAWVRVRPLSLPASISRLVGGLG